MFKLKNQEQLRKEPHFWLNYCLLYWVFDIIWQNNQRFPPHPPPIFLFLSIYMCLFILKYWNLMGSLWQFIWGCPSQLSTMIYTVIDIFYLIDEQLKNSPSRKDGINEATQTTLRIYGCNLIQKNSILLRLYVVILFLLFFLIEMQLVHTILISPIFLFVCLP